jgi:plasmid stability protein
MTDLLAQLSPDAQFALRSLAERHSQTVDAEARHLLEQAIVNARRRAVTQSMAHHRSRLERNTADRADGVDQFLAEKRIDVLLEEGLIEVDERNAWLDLIATGRVAVDEVQAVFDEVWPWSHLRSS